MSNQASSNLEICIIFENGPNGFDLGKDCAEKANDKGFCVKLIVCRYLSSRRAIY